MATYQAPLRDMQFVLHELLGAEREFAALPGYEETTRDLIDPVLEEAGQALRERDVSAQPGRRPGRMHIRGRGGAHPDRISRRVPRLRRRRMGRTDLQSGVRGAGAAPHPQRVRRGDAAVVQPGARPVPGTDPRRLHRARQARQRRSAQALSSEARRRHLVRRHVPHGVALRHRSRTAAHPGRAHRRRTLPGDRNQDIHHRRRAGSEREHRPLRPRPAVGCARGSQGHQHVPRAQVPGRGGRVAGRAQRRQLRLHRTQDGHQGCEHLRDELRRRDRLSDRRAAPRDARDVLDDELRAPHGRPAGACSRRGRVSERGRLCPRPASGPQSQGSGGARSACRPDHRSPRRAADAAHHPRLQRSRTCAARVGLPAGRSLDAPSGSGGTRGGR